jgi:hypothetical protein
MTTDNPQTSSDYSSPSSVLSNRNQSSPMNVFKELTSLIFDLRGVCKDLCNMVQHIDQIANRAEEKLNQLVESSSESIKFSPVKSRPHVQSNEEILLNIIKNKKPTLQELKCSRSKSQPILKPQLSNSIRLPIEPIYESLKSNDIPLTKKPLSKALKRNSMIESSFYEDKLEDELEKELSKNRFIQTSNSTATSPSSSSEKSSELKLKTNHVCFNLNNTIYKPKDDIPIPITALKGTKLYEFQIKQKNNEKLKDVVEPNKKSFALTKIIRKNSCSKNDFKS